MKANLTNTHLRPCTHCLGRGTEPDPKAIGAALRTRRENAGVSLRRMAGALALTPPYVSDLERGQRRWNETTVARYLVALERLAA